MSRVNWIGEWNDTKVWRDAFRREMSGEMPTNSSAWTWGVDFANRNSLANRDIDFHRATLSILGITFMHQGSLLFVAFMLIGHSVMVWLVSLEVHSWSPQLWSFFEAKLFLQSIWTPTGKVVQAASSFWTYVLVATSCHLNIVFSMSTWYSELHS